MEEHLTKETQKEIDDRREIENLMKVEASLFVAGKFLSEQELVALTDINPILLDKALGELKERYGSGSAIEVVNKGDLWKMDVSIDYRDIVNKLATGSEEFTKAEQETLAIIAHKQPVSQSKIIHIRGNKAYDHVKRLVDVGLVVSKKLGRTRELALSDEFYDYFNVAYGGKEKVLELKDKGVGENEAIEESVEIEKDFEGDKEENKVEGES